MPDIPLGPLSESPDASVGEEADDNNAEQLELLIYDVEILTP